MQQSIQTQKCPILQHARLETNRRRIILGQNVIRLRGVRGLTQEKLAELVDVDRRYIQRITANPGIDVLARLKVALSVSWTRLLD